jgi:hypothetical protein
MEICSFIYQNLADRIKIINNNDLFKGCSKLDLSNVDKRPSIIIKGLSIEEAHENYEMIKNNYGIVGLQELKNKFSGKAGFVVIHRLKHWI